METTHALFVLDNWDGQGERYWVFAYKKDGEFYASEGDKLILEHVGDKILNEIELPL
jgi:hypothetical protein